MHKKVYKNLFLIHFFFHLKVTLYIRIDFFFLEGNATYQPPCAETMKKKTIKTILFLVTDESRYNIPTSDFIQKMKL